MTRIPVVAAVVFRGDRVLVGQRPMEKRHGGQWEFPGGKVGRGESEAAAVHRELAEELGVDVAHVGPQVAAFEDPGSGFEIRFRLTEFAGEPRALEHQALRWVTPDEAVQLDLAPSDRRFVEEILPGLRGEARAEAPGNAGGASRNR